MTDSRRDFIKKGALLTLGGLAVSALPGSTTSGQGPLETMASENNLFTLPALPYPYYALEPHIDRMTMEIHHTKHHQTYIVSCIRVPE